MPKSFNAGDVRVLECTMRNAAGGRISLLAQLQGMDIYEDVGKPTIFASFYIFDAIGLLADFPIQGEEEVTVTFETPGISEPATYTLRVYEVTNVQQTNNRMALAYTLLCVSAEHFRNGTPVQQGFNGTMSDYVKLLCKDYLKTKKPLRVEETKGTQLVVSPSWKPLEAIDYARKSAVSKLYAGSAFVFYESQAGFTFASIEHLCATQSVGSRVFTFPYTTVNEKETVQYRAVLEHEIVSKNDSIEAINNGMMRAETTTFDLLTKELSVSRFDIMSAFPRFRGTEKRQLLGQSPKFVKESAGLTKLFAIKDSSRPEDYVESAAAARASYVSLLNSSVTRLLVHGDSGLKAGDMISLQVPEIKGTTARKSFDAAQSGNYIVLRLRHQLTMGAKPLHECSLDVGRVGIRR